MKQRILFIFRQLARSSRQALLFVVCVALSICSITAFTGFSDSINQSVLNDARTLHAADVLIRSKTEISGPLDNLLSDWIRKGQIQRARVYEFNSVVRTADDASSLLADIKIVEKGYPFYGRVLLKSGRNFHDVLKSGRTVVDASLLDRMGIRAGDVLKVGYVSLIVDDVAMNEPDRPVNMFSFGPRVFIADEDRDRLGLIRKGSRVEYTQLLKVLNNADVDALTNRLKAVTTSAEVRIDTFQTAQSRFKRFLDNFLFFLTLVGFFVLVVSGFGIQMTLTAFLNEKKATIAIMKTLGATNRYIIRHFLVIVFIMGFVGIICGLVAGYGIQNGLARMLRSFLPTNIQLLVSWAGIAEGIFLGVAVLAMFTVFPLYRVKDMRPVVILRKDVSDKPKKRYYVLSGVIFLVILSALVFWHTRDFQFGAYLISGMCGLILVTYIATAFVLSLAQKIKFRQLAFRQAVKGLFRRDNATKPIVVTLTASLCVIFSIFLMQMNLDVSFVQSYPPGAPNVFFIDIQPSQAKAFTELIGQKVTLYPVVRARIVSINGIKIDPEKEQEKRRDNFSRVFNLTYQEVLLPNEKLISGKHLFRNDWKEPQVSILDMVVEMRPLSIGDMMEFNIQGVPLKARVSSIRTREGEAISPFFYFVFQEKILGSAPQTIFSALHLEKDRIPALQNAVVSKFPNITVIDVTETLKIFSGLLTQLSTIIRFFALLSIAAGLLILISAVFATRTERIIESVYYKVLGAKKAFVFKVIALENFFMGILAGLLALFMAQAVVYLICKHVLEIPYHFFLATCVLMVLAVVLLVVLIGIFASRSILDKKPISILKEQPDG
ncbi:MAG: FtsX-like permease family protein [Desulfobacteraceae bacterium]|nr:FtsX-like permease family protein [Desulfobacteraceae bacterium]